MTAVAVRASHDDAIQSQAASGRAVGDLEVPRPLRLLLTASCSVGESAGLPMAAYLLADWVAGRSAGMIAGLAAIWLTTVIRKVMTGSVPSLLTISALVLTVQTAMALALMLCTVTTIAFTVAGTGASALWFSRSRCCARPGSGSVSPRPELDEGPGVFWLIRTGLGSRTEDARMSKRHPTRGNTMYIGIGTVVLIVIIVLVVLMLRRR